MKLIESKIIYESLYNKKAEDVHFLVEHATQLEISRLVRDKNLTEKKEIKIPPMEIEKKNGVIYFSGPFAVFGIVNLNERRYPKGVMEEAVKNYNDIYIHKRRSYSELGHPDNSDVNLHLVSHRITDPLEIREDGVVFGRALVLNKPGLNMGYALHSLLEDGGTIGTSTRGLGDLKEVELEEGKKIYDVSEYLLTAIDVVWEPSSGRFIEVENNIKEKNIIGRELNMEKFSKISSILLG